MDWTASSYPKDTIYNHQWTIEDFPKAMKRNDGKIDSPTFKMPRLQRSFFLRITRSQCDRKMDRTNYDDVFDGSGHAKGDSLVDIDGINDSEQNFVSHLFDVWLLAKHLSDDLKKLKLAGTLELSQGTTEVRSKGHFIGFEEGIGPYSAEASGSGFASIHSEGWQFAKERFQSFKWGTELHLDPYDELPCADFYALDHTPELTLKAIIKIPSSMVHSAGVVNSPDEERFPFKHLIDQKDFKDVTLKIGDREFRGHRVILANK